jgi:Rho GTPase-activating protein RGD1
MFLIHLCIPQTKDLANQFERSVEESAIITEKSKARLDATSEELERILLQKEGESFKDAGLQGRAPGGSGAVGKRALGKAVAKGGMLLKGRNPGNVSALWRHVSIIIFDTGSDSAPGG